MKPLKPDGKIDLEHRTYFVRGSTGNPVFTAASEDGYVSLVDVASKSARLHRPTMNLRAISPHPTEPLIACVDGNSGLLVIQRFTGKAVAEISPPCIAAGTSRLVKQGFEDCYFDEAGNVLWLVASKSDDECELLLLETNGWSVIQRSIVVDRFRASSCSFHCTGKPGLVSLWIAAGQDGQEIYWLKCESDGFSAEKVEELDNCIPPVFSRDGSELLVVNQDNSICRYAFQGMKPIGLPLESGDEDNPFAESLCYLNDQYALASTCEGRIFLVDVKNMRIEDEVAIEGHEPRPIGEYYPGLAKERGLGTDISWFTRLGDEIIFIYRRDRGTGLQGWKDSLLWYSVNK